MVIRIAAAESACGTTGTTRRQHAATVSCGPADRCRSPRGQSGVCRCHSPAPVRSDGLSRHGHLVMAASASCSGSRAPGCAARPAGSNRQALARSESTVVVSDREYARLASFRTLVLALSSTAAITPRPSVRTAAMPMNRTPRSSGVRSTSRFRPRSACTPDGRTHNGRRTRGWDRSRLLVLVDDEG